jgi:hypothetical protein
MQEPIFPPSAMPDGCAFPGRDYAPASLQPLWRLSPINATLPPQLCSKDQGNPCLGNFLTPEHCHFPAYALQLYSYLRA